MRAADVGRTASGSAATIAGTDRGPAVHSKTAATHRIPEFYQRHTSNVQIVKAEPHTHARGAPPDTAPKKVSTASVCLMPLGPIPRLEAEATQKRMRVRTL